MAKGEHIHNVDADARGCLTAALGLIAIALFLVSCSILKVAEAIRPGQPEPAKEAPIAH